MIFTAFSASQVVVHSPPAKCGNEQKLKRSKVVVKIQLDVQGTRVRFDLCYSLASLRINRHQSASIRLNQHQLASISIN